MLKRCFSIVLVICMMMSLCTFTFADYSYIDGFEENNMSAKKIVIAKDHAFVASGADNEATDVLNVYNLSTKELVATYAVPVYETGRNYFVENMYVVDEYMYISWNRNRGWGDPFIRKYVLEDLIGGKFEHVFTTGIRGDHVTAIYEDKLFYSEPGYRTLDIITTGADTAANIMNLSENDRNYLEKDLKDMHADANYFYLNTNTEIRAYTTENVYNGMMQSYENTTAVYNSKTEIKGTRLYDGKLFVMSEQGLEVLSLEDGTFKSVGKYTTGGEIMAVTPVGKDLYVYAHAAKAIQILDITDLGNITLKEEIPVNNADTEGIVDIAVVGNRIYAADLTDGFALYSANELDSLQQSEEKVAESYAEELEMSGHAKAIELCVGLRIMELRADGLFAPKGYITRGEFAQSAAKLLGDSVNGAESILKFTDVPKDSEYAEGIYGLANLGVLNGYGDGTFKPDAPVLYEHAVQIMIKVLGYYPLVQKSGRTCMDLAAELDILEKTSQMSNGYISRENVARLIYNSLETPTLKFVSGMNPYKYESNKDDILLHKMGLKKIRGQITATQFTSLSGGYTASKGKVEIGDTEYPEGSSGAGSWLGRNVTAYHRFDDDTEYGELVYVVPNDKDTVLIIDAEDISSETTKSVFCYYDENYKLKKENIKNATVILNGIFDSAFTAADLVPDDGEVTLLDADGDSGIDTVIVKSFKTYVVDAYGGGIFRLQYGYSEINLNELERSGEKISVNVDGYLAEDIEDINGVKQFSILSVMQSRGGELTEIYVTNNSAVGMITSMTANEKMTVEDTEYEISKSHLENVAKPENEIPSVTAGDEVFAYLDMFGKVAAVKLNNTAWRYGYLIACDRGDGLNADKANFKLLAADESELNGSIQKYNSSDVLKVNGERTEDIYTVSELFSENGLKEQIIKFTLDNEGKIKELFTAKDKVNAEISEGVANPYYEADYVGYTENEFTYDALISSSSAYRAGDMGSFEGEPFIPTLSTQIFVVPDIDDPKDEEYKMYDNVTLFRSGTYPPGKVHVYDVGYDYNIGAIVVKTGGEVNIDAIADSSNYMIVDSFRKGLDENGEEVTVLVSSKDASGNQTTINLLNDEIADPAGTCNASYQGVKLVDVPKGSIIQYVTNARGYLAAMRILYMPTETKTYFEYGAPTAPRADYMSVTFYTAFAKVIRLSGNRIIFNGRGSLDDNGDGVKDREWDGNIATANRKWDRNLRAADAKVYLYDSLTDKITTISLTDVLPEDDIFIVKDGVYTELIVVYR